MNRYRAHPPPTTREQYTMAKQPQQPQRMRSTKTAHRRKTDRRHRNTQAARHRQPHMLTRAADSRNPKEASNGDTRSPPRHPCRETGRWTQTGRKRTEEQAASLRTTSARHPHDHRNRKQNRHPSPNRPARRVDRRDEKTEEQEGTRQASRESDRGGMNKTADRLTE